MRLYTFSGLGADHRAFQYLRLNATLIHVSWIPPRKGECLEEYALRMAEKLDTREAFGVLGLSFGGCIATEISKVLSPERTILISSAEVRQELPRWIRWFPFTDLFQMLPSGFFIPPPMLAQLLFQASHKKLLYEIIRDTDPKFAKWAVLALLQWKNQECLSNVLKICGAQDRLIPPSSDHGTYWIAGGTHFMIVDKAEEISTLINRHL